MKELNKNEIYSLEGLSEEQFFELAKKTKLVGSLLELEKAKYIVYIFEEWLYGCKLRIPTAKALDLFEEEKETPSRHYNNEKGSLYKFCEEKGLNSYEFDLIKRIMRCRKKGQFIEDLEKTKYLINLYIKEYETQS